MTPAGASFSKTCTLYIHHGTTPVLFSPDALRIGTVLKVAAAPEESRDRKDALSADNAATDVRDYASSRSAGLATAQQTPLKHVDSQPFLFIVRELAESERPKFRDFQISVSAQVAAVHGFHSRMRVHIMEALEEDHAASHVELSFSDPLNRADLWKLTINELSRRRCIFQGQELLFLGNIKIGVRKLFINGERAASGLFTKNSKPIFRSTSARFIIGIQISREMCLFDDELSGSILWAKAADFIATLLERWNTKGTHHMLSIVLFARLTSPDSPVKTQSSPTDLYRVVTSDMPAFKNASILRRLNQSFRSFVHELRVHGLQAADQKAPRQLLTFAKEGNLLEAINVAISACWLDELDLDFERTGTSIVMLSPGAGSFDVDENLLRVTGERLSSHSIGVELVCLSALPLHFVPLFVLSNKHEHRSVGHGHEDEMPQTLPESEPATSLFVMPSWIETSFYGGAHEHVEERHASEAHRLVEVAQKDQQALPKAALKYSNPSIFSSPAPNFDDYDAQLFCPRAKSVSADNSSPTHSKRDSAAVHNRRISRSSVASSAIAGLEATQAPVRKASQSSVPSLALSAQSSSTKGRISSLLGRAAFGKANTTASSSIEQASSMQRQVSSQSVRADPGSIAAQVQKSLARNTSSSTAASPSPKLAAQKSSHLHDVEKSNNAAEDRPQTPQSEEMTGAESPKDVRRSTEQEPHVSKRRTTLSGDLQQHRDRLPWLVIKNPCKVETEALDAFGEWNHAFTSERKAYAVKWKALCAPASLPLTTEHYPTKSELELAFEVNPHRVSLHMTNTESQSVSTRRGKLAREMVLYRISEGFQIAVGTRAAKIIGPQAANAADFYADDFMAEDGAAAMMLKGDDIHILCAAGDEVSVTRYHRRSHRPSAVHYSPQIRTYLDKSSSYRDLTFKVRDERNWSRLDDEIAETEADSFERQMVMPTTTSHPRRARFVLIPIDPPQATRQSHPTSEETDEEIRLDGIRKLTMVWQKNRWIPPEDEKHHARWIGHKDINPLAIEYQTRDPSAIVAAGFVSSILTNGESTAAMTHLFDTTEQYRTSHVDLQKLATELQGDEGINVRSRRWHFRVYDYCFVAHDLVSFLLGRFQDINNRDEAVDFGNVLMQNGLFKHVNNKHRFRDGNYFFTISKDYRSPKSDTKSGWLARKSLASVPSTPLTEAPKEFPDPSAAHARGFPAKRPKVVLSGMIQYNIDTKHISSRPEIITIHYDRLHHPDNAFHFMLEWTNATAKLVEDALATWSAAVSRSGLKLVQVPIAEVVMTPQINPLRSPYVVEMASKAASTTAPLALESPMLKPQKSSNAKYFQKELLKRFDYVLDFEASSSFPPDVDVEYSYGQDEFRYDQYIHKSGLLLAEIVDDWKFLILANRLSDSRTKAHRAERASLGDALSRAKTSPMLRQTSGAALSTMTTDTLSPVVSPQLAHGPRTNKQLSNLHERPSVRIFGRPAEKLLEELETFCSDGDALRAFYDEISRQATEKPTPALSAMSVAQTPSMMASIPNLDLPEELENETSAI